MPERSWPFVVLGPGQPPRPMVLVSVQNPHSVLSIRVLALIDTGADECALPASLARTLGHDLSRGRAKVVGTAGGQVTAFTHTARLMIDGFGAKDGDVDFIPGLGVPLLGVKSFLADFVLLIDYPRQLLTLRI